jgi:hypothetical protein
MMYLIAFLLFIIALPILAALVELLWPAISLLTFLAFILLDIAAFGHTGVLIENGGYGASVACRPVLRVAHYRDCPLGAQG